MTTLPNFPFVNQLNAPTLDGRPDENKFTNCVPASIAAGLEYFNHKPYSPDAMKDFAYGEGWSHQGTSAAAFVPYCNNQGVKLYPVSAPTAGELIARAHQELAAGRPVVFTQQNDYGPQTMTHVCIWFADNTGSLTAMDPFGGKSLTYSDSQWAGRLRASEIWIMEGKQVVIDLTTPGVSGFFQAAGTMWQCKQTGFIIGNAMLDFYRKFGGDALCGLTYLGLPVSNEIGLGNGRTKQHYERGVTCYDPGHSNDNPPGSSAVYMMHLYQGVGQDPRVASLQAQVTDLQKQLAAPAPTPDPALVAQNKKYHDALKSVGATVIDAIGGN